MTSIVPSENLDTELVKKTFKNLSYGPVLESDKVAQAWLDSHDKRFGHFINNEWEYPEGRIYHGCTSYTGKALADVIIGTNDDVDKAAKVARNAYKSWSEASPHYRSRMLYSLARNVQKHAKLLAVVVTMDTGNTIRDADVAVVVRHLYHYAGWASLMNTEMDEWSSVGVVAAIDHTYSLLFLVCKLAPALAMGNVVVLSHSLDIGVSALLFADICKEAGLPGGVFQVVILDNEMDKALCTHAEVDMVVCKVCPEDGQQTQRRLAGSGKMCSLELPGTTTMAVFEDADLEGVVQGVMDAFDPFQFPKDRNRLLVQESVYDELIGMLEKKAGTLRTGDCLDKCIDIPYRLEDQKSFNEFFETISFRTAKEAVSLANDCKNGSSASVWTEKMALGLEVAKMIKVATVWINAHNLVDAAAGVGSCTISGGYSRDGGKECLYEYVRHKDVSKPSGPCLQNLEGFGDCLPGGLPCGGGVGSGGSGSGGSGGGDVGSGGSGGGDVGSGGSGGSGGDGGGSGGLPIIDRTFKMYYGGSQKRPDSNYSRPIRDHQNKIIAHVGEGNRKDIRNAVEAAHKAFPGWSKKTGHNRAQILYYVAENLEQRKEEFSQALVALLDCERSTADEEIDLAIERLFHWAAYADKYGGKVQETELYVTSIQINEPIGVIGIVCPAHRHPLLAMVSLVSAAIGRSNCVIVIPSEKHPLLALMMIQVFDTSDVPGGVVNIVTGNSDHLTKCIAEHRDVQAIWHFGESAIASKFVQHASTNSMARTWVDGGVARNWTNHREGCGEEFLYHSNQVKHIWMSMGDIQ